MEKLYQKSSVKYLGIKIDQRFNWQDHINNIAIKLNKANSMIMNFVNDRTWISFYNAILDYYLNYASIVRAKQKVQPTGYLLSKRKL